MNPSETTKISKLLSYLLRHSPGDAGLQLDNAGWIEVDDLLKGVARMGRTISRDQLDYVVENNAKKRFEYSQDHLHIRASQGHSVEVDLNYEQQWPPEFLYHGSASRFIDSIRELGLQKMKRHHVHLSAETKVTMEVGARRGRPILLTIRAAEMNRAGHSFYCSTNGVWLTDHVPPAYIDFPQYSGKK